MVPAMNFCASRSMSWATCASSGVGGIRNSVSPQVEVLIRCSLPSLSFHVHVHDSTSFISTAWHCGQSSFQIATGTPWITGRVCCAPHPPLLAGIVTLATSRRAYTIHSLLAKSGRAVVVRHGHLQFRPGRFLGRRGLAAFGAGLAPRLPQPLAVPAPHPRFGADGLGGSAGDDA